MGLDVNQKFEEEKTFLHHAVEKNYREVYTLFEADADADAKDKNADADAKDKNGNMALHYACQGNPEMKRSTDWIRTIGYLVNLTTDIDVQNDKGETPFQLVMKGNTEEVVDFTTRLLISKKASITKADYDGNTPLHIAIQTNKNNAIKILIDSMGPPELNRQNNQGETPLHLAVLNGNVLTVQQLLNKEVDLNLKTKQDKTARNVAQDKNYSEIVELLEKKATGGTEPNPPKRQRME